MLIARAATEPLSNLDENYTVSREKHVSNCVYPLATGRNVGLLCPRQKYLVRVNLGYIEILGPTVGYTPFP